MNFFKLTPNVPCKIRFIDPPKPISVHFIASKTGAGRATRCQRTTFCSLCAAGETLRKRYMTSLIAIENGVETEHRNVLLPEVLSSKLKEGVDFNKDLVITKKVFDQGKRVGYTVIPADQYRPEPVTPSPKPKIRCQDCAHLKWPRCNAPNAYFYSKSGEHVCEWFEAKPDEHVGRSVSIDIETVSANDINFNSNFKFTNFRRFDDPTVESHEELKRRVRGFVLQ